MLFCWWYFVAGIFLKNYKWKLRDKRTTFEESYEVLRALDLRILGVSLFLEKLVIADNSQLCVRHVCRVS